MSSRGENAWRDFLDPEVLRPQLIAASVYIACFEGMKDAIISRLRWFFASGFDAKGPLMDQEAYKHHVLVRNRSPLYATLDWFREQGAIDEADLDAFERVRMCRNHLAHNLLGRLGSKGLPGEFAERLREMVDLRKKIDVWWIVNIEAATDPSFDDEEVPSDGVLPGSVLALLLLCEVALGDDDAGRAYIEQLRRHPAPQREGKEPENELE